MAFDVHVLTSTAYATTAFFEHRVSNDVDAPNVVAIGLVPLHRTTVVRFGLGTNVPEGQWATIAKAGDGAFKNAHWGDGLIAIGDRTTCALDGRG